LVLSPVAGPTATKTVITALSCFHSPFFCEAVGYADTTTGVTGLTLTIEQGVVGPLTVTKDFAYEGVWCSGVGVCGTDGNRTTGTSSTELFGIECNGLLCTEAGKVRASKTGPFVGVLITTAIEHKSKTSKVSEVAGFTDISRRGPGSGFAAVGPGQTSGSVLTLGVSPSLSR
jgi:hypothetical protein